MQCPRCDSTNIKSLYDVYNEGYKRDNKDYTINDLAKEFMPPQPPNEPVNNVENKSIIGWIGMFFLYYFGWGILATIMSLVISIFSKYKFVKVMELLALIFPFIFVYIIYDEIKAKRKTQQLYETRMEQYKKDYEIYRENYKLWCNSYICMRCGYISANMEDIS